MMGPSGRQLQLKFNDFSLEQTKDILTIHDGHSQASPVINTYTGSTLPANVVSRANSLYIEFVSDAQNSYHGFQLEYLIKGDMLSSNCNTNLKKYFRLDFLELIFYIFLVEPDHFFKLYNQTCKTAVGNYPTLAMAIGKCSATGPCIIVDEGCDDINKFKVCPGLNDLMETSEPTCVHHRSVLKI